MATDLFGKLLGGSPRPEFTLNLQQKRQATLLYHWMSLDYLKGLKNLIDALIKGADVNLELAQRQGRDELIVNPRWGVRDTAANWSTHVFPALEDFRKSTIKDIALRAVESYEFTGANQCGRMLSEFSSTWMTEEEEEQFKQQWEAVYQYASKIDYAAGVGGQRRLTDFNMAYEWRRSAHLFVRMPRFQVRTDVEGVSGKKPLRSGVYVTQDDPHATLQFAWTGNNDGVLGDASTFNQFGLHMISVLGKGAFWHDDQRLRDFASAEMSRNSAMDAGPYTLEDLQSNPDAAGPAMAFAAFVEKPCKWYFVEKVEGEFDDEVESSGFDVAATPVRLRVEAGQPCPRAGYWFTPASPDSRKHFAQGEAMPAVGGDYGATIWQWDERQ